MIATERETSTREAIMFCALTLGICYLICWGPIVILGIPTISFVDDIRGPLWATVLFMTGGFVPSLTAIALTAIRGGRPELARLFRSAVRFDLGWKWYVAIFVIVGVGTACQIGLQAMLGHPFDFGLFIVQLPSFVPLLVIGPLSEEFGWRGYLLPRVRARRGPALASLIVGAVWAAWHAPLFLMVGTSQHELDVPYLGFFIAVVSMSVIMTWLSERTDGRLWMAILFHWIYTYAIQVVATGVTRSPLYNWIEHTPYVLMAVVLFVILVKRGSPPDRAVASP